MKILMFFYLLVFSSLSFAQPFPEFLSVKDRLRIILWTEGLQEQQKTVKENQLQPRLPEELERALRKSAVDL
jgi:hypothetical protein